MLSFLRSQSFAAVLFVLIVGAAASPAPIQAQQLEDVVYFTDGRIIRGTIVEQTPGESLLIRTRDGNVLRFELAQIARIAKEGLIAPAQPEVSAQPRSPGSALALSFLMNGLGQYYNGEGKKGLLHFGVGVVAAGVMLSGVGSCWDTSYTYWDTFDEEYTTGYGEEDCTMYGIGLGGLILTKAWSMYDAYTSANRINRESGVALQFDPRIQLARELVPNGFAFGERGRHGSYKVRLNLGTLHF